jgi:lipopolysaccharide transport system ATP-binding protein
VLEYICASEAVPKNVDVGISIGTHNDQIFSVLYSSYSGQSFPSVPKTGRFCCRIPRLCLAPGRYPIGAAVTVNGVEADCLNGGVGLLDVEAGDFYRTGHPGWNGRSVFLLEGDWSVGEPVR